MSNMSLSQPLETTTFILPTIDKKTITISHTNNNKTNIKIFLNTLNKNELKTLLITYEHLGSSFDIEKSILFLSWINTN